MSYMTSFKGSVSRSFGGSDTCLSVLGMFVCKRKLSQISANHIEFNLDNIKGFTIMDSNEISNHIWHDDGIS